MERRTERRKVTKGQVRGGQMERIVYDKGEKVGIRLENKTGREVGGLGLGA